MYRVELWGKVITASIAAALYSAAHAADTLSVELGGGNQTRIARISLQSKWDAQWWRSNGTHIGGYWDFSLAQWRGDRFQNVVGQRQNITSVSITPVFRFQNNTLKGFYVEAGIGAHLLSELYNNNGHRLSTSFQFGDHLGIGYVFPSTLDLGLRIQHFSNGSIKQPNDGVNLMVVRVAYQF